MNPIQNHGLAQTNAIWVPDQPGIVRDGVKKEDKLTWIPHKLSGDDSKCAKFEVPRPPSRSEKSTESKSENPRRSGEIDRKNSSYDCGFDTSSSHAEEINRIQEYDFI
ncbi:hypothetical protein AYI70_g10379 [Smittium culicis]|uniref:Uncharacterized protein n=1 Tax=Smittium culicis TaxID=133412 RepID=A0A1R1X6T6_9FUNG|nr:hypothetical protein AYI70_g10379 [Smittium culicis]